MIRELVGGSRTVAELSAACGLRGGCSNHVAILKRAGLVRTEREGVHIRCSLVGATVEKNFVTLTHPTGLKVTLPLG